MLMVDQLSNKYLLNTFMVYLHALLFYDEHWKIQVEIIDQLSNKYLVKTLVVYLEAEADDQGKNLQIEMTTSTW